jgi:hypothetical protein
MSDQNPPGLPGDGPDPFEELLKGLREEAPAAPVTPEPADVPTVAFTPPVEPTAAFPTADAQPSEVFPDEFPEPTAVYPAQPVAAAGTPSDGDVPATLLLPGAFQPTAATTVLASGGGVPPTVPPTGGGGFRDWDPRRKALLITLVSVAGVLLIALIILLIVLLSPKSTTPPTPGPSPSHSSSPTPTPTKSATPTPKPTTVKPAVQSFTANSTTAVCPDTGAGTNVTMHFAWTVVGATQIAIASGPTVTDAIANPFQNGLPATATDFQMPFGCANAQLTYTLTIAGPDGQHYSGVLTVTRQYTPPPPVPAPTLSNVSFSDGFVYATCPNFDDGDVVTKDVSWTSTPDGTTVEIWLAQNDTAPPGPGGTFVQVAGGLAASGVYSVPIDCGTSGASGFFTVRVIASNISGSADGYLEGNTAT